MKVQIIKKGDKYCVRTWCLFFWMYDQYDGDRYDGCWFWPDYTSLVDYNKAVEMRNALIKNEIEREKFKRSKITIVE